eukprot:3412021-Prymnesium_polylepis.1
MLGDGIAELAEKAEGEVAGKYKQKAQEVGMRRRASLSCGSRSSSRSSLADGGAAAAAAAAFAAAYAGAGGGGAAECSDVASCFAVEVFRERLHAVRERLRKKKEAAGANARASGGEGTPACAVPAVAGERDGAAAVNGGGNGGSDAVSGAAPVRVAPSCGPAASDGGAEGDETVDVRSGAWARQLQEESREAKRQLALQRELGAPKPCPNANRPSTPSSSSRRASKTKAKLSRPALPAASAPKRTLSSPRRSFLAPLFSSRKVCAERLPARRSLRQSPAHAREQAGPCPPHLSQHCHTQR